MPSVALLFVQNLALVDYNLVTLKSLQEVFEEVILKYETHWLDLFHVVEENTVYISRKIKNTSYIHLTKHKTI